MVTFKGIDEEMEHVIEHEDAQWSKIFYDATNKDDGQPYSSVWWKMYYDDITKYFNDIICDKSKVLELGCGSGKATLLLDTSHDKVLFDISKNALLYAKLLNKKIQSPNVKYIRGNAFDNHLPNMSYDLTWNIGVIEHYTLPLATKYIAEMMRVTKSNGYIAVAVPNFYSLPIIKARLLNLKIFKFIKGYRLDTEHYYNKNKLTESIKQASKISNRGIMDIKSLRVGNPLFMETPSWILRTVGVFINKLMPKSRFLMIIVVKIS